MENILWHIWYVIQKYVKNIIFGAQMSQMNTVTHIIYHY